MLHPEAKNWGTVVIPDFLLFRIEAYALANDGRFGASGAPDRIGHLEADCEYTLPGLTGTIAESMSVDDE